MSPYYSFEGENAKGLIETESDESCIDKIFFTPPVQMLINEDEDPIKYKNLVYAVNQINKTIEFYPYQVRSISPMKSRYLILKKIIVELSEFDMDFYFRTEDNEGFLENVLPQAFNPDVNIGLGFRRSYRSIVSMLEGFKVKELKINLTSSTCLDLDNQKASINVRDLNLMCRTIDNITSRVQRISLNLKKENMADLLIKFIAKDSEDKLYNINFESIKNIGASSKLLPGGANKNEQKDAMDIVRRNTKKIINDQPEELFKLKNDLELVSLEVLINKFRELLSGKSREDQWQKIFSNNPFILNMLFGVHVIKVSEQANVGGAGVGGRGNKIADFLMKNSTTHNVGLIEIKKPDTKLLKTKSYRGGIYGPSDELSGAVNQVLDQIFQFQKDFNSIKINSRSLEIESFFVSGILIAGILPKNVDEQKSFELFRGNSKNIQIITFDELLNKLVSLQNFLMGEVSPIRPIKENSDVLPF